MICLPYFKDYDFVPEGSGGYILGAGAIGRLRRGSSAGVVVLDKVFVPFGPCSHCIVRRPPENHHALRLCGPCAPSEGPLWSMLSPF